MDQNPITVIRNAHIVTPTGNSSRHGASMSELTEITCGRVTVSDNGVIAAVEPESDAPVASDVNVIDLEGNLLLPGFVDSHTHACFAGLRANEFGMRMRGATYMEIMNAGGGIQATVVPTREATVDALAEDLASRIRYLASMGVTTVEVKSGYGLDTASELRMLEAIKRVADNPQTPVRIVATFMGAHAIGAEYKGRTDEYVDMLISEMLPAAADKATFCDVFCEKGVFEIEQTRRILEAAKALGMRTKLHADEIVTLGGAELAAEMGATSADHLLHISDQGVKALAESETIATLLPLTAFSLKEQFAPARKLIDGGAAVALASDFNPGSCYSASIPLMFSLACIYMNMTIQEALTALTLNGAAALGLAAETGSIEVGKRADFAFMTTNDINNLPYHIGANQVGATMSRGRLFNL